MKLERVVIFPFLFFCRLLFHTPEARILWVGSFLGQGAFVVSFLLEVDFFFNGLAFLCCCGPHGGGGRRLVGGGWPETEEGDKGGGGRV